MKNILSLVLLAILGFACTKKNSPNFVVFLVDDLGWADVGANNPNSFYETPNVDHLASGGVLFSDAYASCPVCSPTRASIMTGKHPVRVGITDWIPGQDPKNRKLLGTQDLHELPKEEITLAEALQENGYTTCHVGKWHLGEEGSWPEDHGFDVNIGGWSVGSPRGKGYYSPYANPRLPDGPEGEFLTERLTQEAMSFLDSTQQDPFFLYFAFYTVHTPIQASKKHIDYFNEKLSNTDLSGLEPMRQEHEGVSKLIQDNTAYASMVAAMDDAVGSVLNKIEELGLSDDTYVIFTSDNGGLSTLHKRGYPTSNLPLRAGKGWCYEGGIRVPFILSGPDIKPGISNQLVTSMDIYPTILELAGIEAIPEQHIDGISLMKYAYGPSRDSEPDRTLFWHYPHYHGSAWTPGAALRNGNWKIIEFYDYEKVELYNLANDLEESINLADSLPEKTQELLDELHKKQKELGADFPKINPDFTF